MTTTLATVTITTTTLTTATLTTARLTLRPHLLADYPAFRAFWMSDRTSHIGGPLRHEHEVWRQFTAEAGQWHLHGFGLWTLVSKTGGTILGWVGLQHPPHYDAPECAWHLIAEAEAHGLAHEAASAALADGWGRLGLPRIISYVSATNARSLRLAERLGAVVTERGHFAGTDYALFDHRRGA